MYCIAPAEREVPIEQPNTVILEINAVILLMRTLRVTLQTH